MAQTDYNRENRPRLLRSKWVLRAYLFGIPLVTIPAFLIFCPTPQPRWADALLFCGGISWFLGAFVLGMTWFESVETSAIKILPPLLYPVDQSNLPGFVSGVSTAAPSEMVFQCSFPEMVQTNNASNAELFFSALILSGLSGLVAPWFIPFILIIFGGIAYSRIEPIAERNQWIPFSDLPEAAELKLTSAGIQIGALWVAAGNPGQIRQLLPAGSPTFLLDWNRIREWSVLPIELSGRYRSNPCRYEITFDEESIIIILRTPLIGCEAKILDFARARMTGQILLKDDIDSLRTRIAI